MPSVNNIDIWFHPRIAKDLSKIVFVINQLSDEIRRDFFLVCFSNLVKKVSFADPRISVPVRLNPDRFINDPVQYKKVQEKINSLITVDVFAKFDQICRDNILRISLLKDISGKAYIISDDARNITTTLYDSAPLEDQSVDLILTSPPYAGAQKYIRSSSLSLMWLSLTKPEDLRKLDAQNIGRENYKKVEIVPPFTGIAEADLILNDLYSSGKKERAHVVANYINQMKLSIDESYRVLKTGGYYIMIIGNNTVCGKEFNTQYYLTQYMESIGFNVVFKLIDDIKSYGLMTKRNKTASTISCEWVVVLKK